MGHSVYRDSIRRRAGDKIESALLRTEEDSPLFYSRFLKEITRNPIVLEKLKRLRDEAKSELLYLQEFQFMEHFKLELSEYLDYYNNRRIKAKLKDLPPAIYRQQALSAA